jgi:hypothetical protein
MLIQVGMIGVDGWPVDAMEQIGMIHGGTMVESYICIR